MLFTSTAKPNSSTRELSRSVVEGFLMYNIFCAIG